MPDSPTFPLRMWIFYYQFFETASPCLSLDDECGLKSSEPVQALAGGLGVSLALSHTLCCHHYRKMPSLGEWEVRASTLSPGKCPPQWANSQLTLRPVREVDTLSRAPPAAVPGRKHNSCLTLFGTEDSWLFVTQPHERKDYWNIRVVLVSLNFETQDKWVFV